MPDLIVVQELRTYLIAQGVVQSNATPSLTLPGVWLQPRQGAPMPRQENGEWLETQTVTLSDENLSGPPGLESWLRDAFIDIRVRSVNPTEGKLTLRAITGLLVPIGKLGGRKHWTMNGLLVQESRIWRDEKPLPPVDNGKTYDRIASFQFRYARSDVEA